MKTWTLFCIACLVLFLLLWHLKHLQAQPPAPTIVPAIVCAREVQIDDSLGNVVMRLMTRKMTDSRGAVHERPCLLMFTETGSERVEIALDADGLGRLLLTTPGTKMSQLRRLPPVGLN